MKNRTKQSDNWATPKYFYNKLNEEFNFTFDPCPLNENEITPENDGLLIDWGERNYINPPYSRKLKEAFVKKGIEEAKKGKLCVFLIPVSTSTKLFHEHILPNITEPVRFVKGRVPFIGKRWVKVPSDILQGGYWSYVNWHLWDKEPPTGSETEKNSGQFDSMIIIFDGRNNDKQNT